MAQFNPSVQQSWSIQLTQFTIPTAEISNVLCLRQTGDSGWYAGAD
jgi:hypothetical protein